MALRKSFLISLFLLLWIGTFFAHDGLSDLPPEESSVNNLLGLGARAMGMGGAHIAVAEDFSALWWNPAGLSRIRRIELSGGLIYEKERNRTLLYNYGKGETDSHTKLASGGIAVPIPIYRGSFVFGVGFNRPKSFDSSLKFRGRSPEEGFWQEGLELRSGGLYNWALGAAIDLSPSLSAGATIMLWGGEEDYTWNMAKNILDAQGDTLLVVNNRDHFLDDYSGINLKLGLLFRANRYIIFGGTLESPLRLTIEQDWTSQTDSLFNNDSTIQTEDYGYYKYKLRLPYKLCLGARLTLPYLILATDLNYTDWSQAEYKYPPEDVSSFNPYMSDAYRDVLSWHIGAETLVPTLGVKLRLGYYRDPIPYKLKKVKNSRDYFTFGLGFLMGRVMTLDFALVHGLWETSLGDLDERYTVNRVFITAAYRF